MSIIQIELLTSIILNYKHLIEILFLLIEYDFIFYPQVIHGVHIAPAHIIKKRSINQPLRILMVYDESVYR